MYFPSNIGYFGVSIYLKIFGGYSKSSGNPWPPMTSRPKNSPWSEVNLGRKTRTRGVKGRSKVIQYSHIFRDSYGSGMGIVWEAYHKGVPLLGVPENPIDYFTPRNTPFISRWNNPLILTSDIQVSPVKWLGFGGMYPFLLLMVGRNPVNVHQLRER